MLHMVMKMKTGMPQHKHSRFYYKMIRTNSHTAAIPKRIMEKAAESPNSNTPTASEMINPSMLNTAPITFPHIISRIPTNLNTQIRNKKANKIPNIYLISFDLSNKTSATNRSITQEAATDNRAHQKIGKPTCRY